tara:strand:- start:308 stop:862 length:555 start_codon:yes stop_codon:yes gene_type:complete
MVNMMTEAKTESPMLKMIKSRNPDKKYPSNIGQKWTQDEESLLLNELDQNIDLKIIAENHKRTTGGIRSRCKMIAYKMHLNNISHDEILQKTKLNVKTLKQTIEKRDGFQLGVNKKKSIKIKKETQSSSSNIDIIEMKNDIIELKKTINEMSRMLLKNTNKKKVNEMEPMIDNTIKFSDLKGFN